MLMSGDSRVKQTGNGAHKFVTVYDGPAQGNSGKMKILFGDLERFINRARPLYIGLGLVCCLGSSGVLMWWAPSSIFFWMGLLPGCLGLLASGLVAGRRHYVGRLPLQLSTTAIRARVGGQLVLQGRALLGRGRAMRPVAVQASFERADGSSVVLDAIWVPDAVIVGAWTIVLAGLDDTAQGFVAVTVSVRERSVLWTETGRWDVSEGAGTRFRPACCWRRGQMREQLFEWDRVEERATSV